MDPAASEQAARFSRVYRADATTYGAAPSFEVMHFIDQCLAGVGMRALDLGTGPGRNALALARRGFDVTAVDVAKAGLQALEAEAAREGLEDRVHGRVADIRTLPYDRGSFEVIVAATVLDHIPREDASRLLPSLFEALSANGVIYIEVHTTEDPGSPVGAGRRSDAPVSETAGAIRHYFAPNELLRLVAGRVRVIRYEERIEWDETHGRHHEHGKAVLVGVRQGSHPRYFGDLPHPASRERPQGN
jgi:cyclopropane fatty-acyl-phospholipid synthase-like methyltransferase